jgi:hypothetical protein
MYFFPLLHFYIYKYRLEILTAPYILEELEEEIGEIE